MKRKDYQQPQVMALDMEGYELMQDFIIFSTTEVTPGPPVNPDPDDGVDTGDALVKGFSVWDEE